MDGFSRVPVHGPLLSVGDVGSRETLIIWSVRIQTDRTEWTRKSVFDIIYENRYKRRVGETKDWLGP